MTRQLLDILMFYIGNLSAIHAKYHDLGEAFYKNMGRLLQA